MYGNDIVKKVRLLEKLDYKLRKCSLALEFLNICKNKKVIPTFLQFSVSNKNLRSSQVYRKCQISLLNEEIKTKQSRIRVLTHELDFVKKTLSDILNFIDFTHTCTLFLVSNDKAIKKNNTIHEKKLQKLIANDNELSDVNKSDLSSSEHDPDKLIFNFSSYILKLHLHPIWPKK